MDNILDPRDDFKKPEEECCPDVAGVVAADVAADQSAKPLANRDVAGVADEAEIGEGKADPAPEDGAALLDEITAALRRHVVMTLPEAQMVALWIIHAHTIDAHQHSPRLAVTSPMPNCGKTTLCSVIALLTQTKVSSNTTIAAFFRRIERDGPRVVILDEADTFLSAENKTAIGILNSGHSRAGAYVDRAETTGNGYEAKTFCVWAPVVFGLIGKLPAAALESRSLGVLLKRKRRDERIETLRTPGRHALYSLQVRAFQWGSQHLAALCDADPELPDCLYNRDRDNWRPLIAIADEANSHWPKTARAIAEELNGQAEDPSEGVMLLADIRQIFEENGTDRLSTQNLIAALSADEERPWHDYRDQGLRITDKQLAHLLKLFGIRPSSVRVEGKGTPKGYMRVWFEDAFERYLPPCRDPAPAATSATMNPLNGLEAAQCATAGATSDATEGG
jgi:hypothetical protein